MKLVIDLQGAQTESRLRGIGRQTRMLARALLRHAGAHDVVVVLNRALAHLDDPALQDLLALLPPSAIRYFDVPGPVAERDLRNAWRMRAAELARESVLAGLEPDVLLVSSLFEGMNDDAVTSIGLLQAPYATAATLFDLIPLFDPDHYLAAEPAQRFYYRRAQSLKRADLLLAISDSARREAVEVLGIAPSRIDVTPLAADDVFRPAQLTQADKTALRAKYHLPGPFIFYVGAIEPRKNVGLIIEAFARLPESLRSTHWMVFGGKLHPPERLQLRAVAARSGTDVSRLVFPGYIDEADLPALYALCSVFVFPSIHEGFGLPPLEAMACGAAVLAADNSALPEVVGRRDLLFSTHDPDDLSARMARMLGDIAYAASVREWGVRQAATFSWDKTGRTTLQSLERLHARSATAVRSTTFGQRPRLAFFSPLPPDRSGVADYSADLLRELSRFYDVECIVADTNVGDPWLLANLVFRDLDFFRRHSESYARIVYSIGNSSFHAHMFDLMQAYPGIVILHDFFLSGVLDWLGNVGRRPKEEFARELYLTHGLPALLDLRDHGRTAAAARYPCNRLAFEDSIGVIVHSRWSLDQARRLYGDDAARKTRFVPMLRATSAHRSRAEARRRLALAPDEHLVCSFGFVSDTKLADIVLQAWDNTAAARSSATRLVFVGENAAGPFGQAMLAAIAERPGGQSTVEITGYVSQATYRDYLAAADLAVQLRTNSRGETSRAVLDCLAAGLPLVLNAHGTNVELPEDVVTMLPEHVAVDDLATALDTLLADPARRATLGEAGLRYIRMNHLPETVGEAMRDAIEAFALSTRRTATFRALRDMHATVFPSEQDLALAIETLARDENRFGPRRLLVDVTLLAEADGHTGIERVVRSILGQLIRQPPSGFRVEPVRIDGHRLRFARRFLTDRFRIPAAVLPDSIVDHDRGDIYLMLEWAADRLPLIAPWLQQFRQDGGQVVIGINDLLPLLRPDWFPPAIAPIAERWFEQVLLVADQLVCISRSTADDAVRLGNMLMEPHRKPIAVDWYHCASNLGASSPTRGLPLDAATILEAIAVRPTFLMVGTVEPRKGHAQVIEACARLWAQGADIALVIVGKKGWMVDGVERAIDRSPENSRRLFWLQGISDEFLEQLYGACTALVAASEGEGFGLPLIEAMRHNLPVLARDLPVFREVVGSYATFFGGTDPETLALALASAFRKSRPPNPRMIQSRPAAELYTWAHSATCLLAAIAAPGNYGSIVGPLTGNTILAPVQPQLVTPTAAQPS